MPKMWHQKNYHESSLEKKLLSQLNRNRIPNLKQLKYLTKFLNPKERWLMGAALATLVISSLFLIYGFRATHLSVVADYGGKYFEGSLVTPSYINPLYYGTNTTDDSLSRLIFSALWRRDASGALEPDLVANYQISTDQKTYTIGLTKNAHWHSGEKVTSDDVIFTFNTIKDARYKSPYRKFFAGVDIEKLDDYSFKLTLKEAYAPFLELLSFGILPKHLWADISPNNISLAELNIKPVGSGPYKFKSLTKDKAGNIKQYSLVVNKDYYRTRPFIDEFDMKFFASTEEMIDALNNNRIDAVSYLPSEADKLVLAPNTYHWHQIKQPELSALYFNLQTQSILSDKALRQALAQAIDKSELIKQFYGGRAEIAHSPIPSCAFAYDDRVTKYAFDITAAKKLLADAGWKDTAVSSSASSTASSSLNFLTKNNTTLEIKLTVIDSELELKLAEFIAQAWRQLGVKVEVLAVDKNIFYSQVIKPKNYSVLLYNTLNQLNSDPYVYWDSSQIADKGYNLSNYSNPKVDKLLQDARINNDLNLRLANYQAFQKIISDEIPAIFLTNPKYLYLQNKRIKGFTTTIVNASEDVFYNTTGWYIKEKKKIKF